MKKGLYLFIFILIFLNAGFSYAQTAPSGCDPSDKNCGVNLCNVQANCGADDDICPEDFFPPGKSCYIEDPDCCTIKVVGWSSSPDRFESTDEVEEGKRVYMYVETDGCNGKDAFFNVYLVDENLLSSDIELLSDTTETLGGPFEVRGEKVSAGITAYTDPAAFENGISKFKFRVKINPEGVSSLLEVFSDESTDSCSDFIDNDADGCADETLDCSDGKEDVQNPEECAAFSEACMGWKCNTGDCVDGRKTVTCPPLPIGCQLTMPPKFVKCYEKSVPFPFFDKFNFFSSIFSLVLFYGFRLRRK